MIFFDATKTGGSGHRSGLMRVSARLAEELGPAARAVRMSWLNQSQLTACSGKRPVCLKEVG